MEYNLILNQNLRIYLISFIVQFFFQQIIRAESDEKRSHQFALKFIAKKDRVLTEHPVYAPPLSHARVVVVGGAAGDPSFSTSPRCRRRKRAGARKSGLTWMTPAGRRLRRPPPSAQSYPLSDGGANNTCYASEMSRTRAPRMNLLRKIGTETSFFSLFFPPDCRRARFSRSSCPLSIPAFPAPGNRGHSRMRSSRRDGERSKSAPAESVRSTASRDADVARAFVALRAPRSVLQICSQRIYDGDVHGDIQPGEIVYANRNSSRRLIAVFRR